MALLLTTGEQQTISYLSIILDDLGIRTKAMTGYQAGIKTFGGHMKSRIADIDTLSDEKGTWIMEDTQVLERKAVTGVLTR